ncbi:MAG: serine--tRNA ligase [Patescibacteria group bacterium]
MLDLKFIRQNQEKVKEGLAKKQVNIDIDRLLALDETRRESLQKIESLRAEQNKLGKEDIVKAQGIKAEIKSLEPALADIEKELNSLLRQLPNLPLDDVPVGKDEKDNVVLREEGKKPKFDFEPKDYLAISEKLDLIDVKRAAKVSGTRFGYLKGEAALLEFALINLAFDVLSKERFISVIPPVMIKTEMMEAMGYIDTPEDRAERYFLENGKLVLVGTSEQSIGPMHQGEILEEKDLPRRYVAFSTCFREEAGAYGKDTKGILRVHQFDKVEMFTICQPEKSQEEHQLLLKIEEKLMQLLKLPYRVVHLSSGDISRPSASTYDIETWLPGQKEYRETHSSSNCTDFQARRLDIRYRSKIGVEYVHTLNGTAFAIGRMLIAIIENYQQKDGSIEVPKVLQKYTGFKRISRGPTSRN